MDLPTADLIESIMLPQSSGTLQVLFFQWNTKFDVLTNV